MKPMNKIALRSAAIGLLALPLCGCLAEQERAIVGLCKGKPVQPCMDALGYMPDFDSPYCAVLAPAARVGDAHCYVPKNWFARMATRIQMRNAVPPQLPGSP